MNRSTMVNQQDTLLPEIGKIHGEDTTPYHERRYYSQELGKVF